MNNEAAYWITLAHLPRWGNLKINKLIITFFHDNNLTIEDFFQLSEQDWRSNYNLEYKDIEDLKQWSIKEKSLDKFQEFLSRLN